MGDADLVVGEVEEAVLVAAAGGEDLGLAEADFAVEDGDDFGAIHRRIGGDCQLNLGVDRLSGE